MGTTMTEGQQRETTLVGLCLQSISRQVGFLPSLDMAMLPEFLKDNIRARMGDVMAELFLKHATESKIDPSVGFILQIPQAMRTGNDVYLQTLAFCEDRGIAITPRFFRDLERLVTEISVSHITPQAYVVSKKKATTLDMYHKKRESWGIHHPFFFQTCPGSAFFIYRTVSDALLALVDILENRQAIYTKPEDGSRVPLTVDWVLEHVVGDNPCYALFDLDEYPNRYQGRISEQEIDLLIQGFPCRFTTLLIDSGCVADQETLIEVKIKDRSRWDREKQIRKMSFHNIFSLFAPKSAHRLAVAACLQQPFNSEMSLDAWLSQTRKLTLATGGYDSVPTELLKAKNSPASLLSLDPAALPGGSNGITTFLSVKKRGDPPSTHGPTTTYWMGLPVEVQECPYPTPHDLHSDHLTLQDRLLMLRSMSYTIPQRVMTFYSDDHLLKTLRMQSGLAQVNQS